MIAFLTIRALTSALSSTFGATLAHFANSSLPKLAHMPSCGHHLSTTSTSEESKKQYSLKSALERVEGASFVFLKPGSLVDEAEAGPYSSWFRKPNDVGKRSGALPSGVPTTYCQSC